MGIEETMFLVFEAAQKYVELKENRNPMVKLADRAEEFALRELKTSIQNVENILKEE